MKSRTFQRRPIRTKGYEIAIHMGLKSIDEWYEDKFRVKCSPYKQMVSIYLKQDAGKYFGRFNHEYED